MDRWDYLFLISFILEFIASLWDAFSNYYLF